MASGCRTEEEGSAAWRLLGAATALSTKRCRLLYSSLGRSSDVCLFYVKGEFFAMDARCAHSGKASVLSAEMRINPFAGLSLLLQHGVHPAEDALQAEPGILRQASRTGTMHREPPSHISSQSIKSNSF